jgi:ketosteroid isomerase-like protein
VEERVMNVEDTFLSFVLAVNRHDIEALRVLMTDDHVFVDSMGHREVGADTMKSGWIGYFAMCPDYWIHTDHFVVNEELVLAVGEARGTIDGVEWRTPAAWKALIREGKVAEWRVFADNKPVYDILARRQKG